MLTGGSRLSVLSFVHSGRSGAPPEALRPLQPLSGLAVWDFVLFLFPVLVPDSIICARASPGRHGELALMYNSLPDISNPFYRQPPLRISSSMDFFLCLGVPLIPLATDLLAELDAVNEPQIGSGALPFGGNHITLIPLFN
jgi:hypothetical protein